MGVLESDGLIEAFGVGEGEKYQRVGVRIAFAANHTLEAGSCLGRLAALGGAVERRWTPDEDVRWMMVLDKVFVADEKSKSNPTHPNDATR